MNFIDDWAILESDFRREYGINLVEDRRLSWRSFNVLANGLSPNSIWVLTYQGRNEGEIAIEDPEAAERAFDKMG